MADDPAFLFYPGDYLRDTQCLSEKTQAAYDRIMCEHMRNICISQQQLNFFTKRLSDDEKNELLHILKKITGGFQIQWVAESICKRKSYSESRAKNRKGKSKNISSTYDNHMENEIVNENINENSFEKGAGETFVDEKFLLPEMLKEWKKVFKNYPDKKESDYPALLSIAQFIADKEKIDCDIGLMPKFRVFISAVNANDFYRDKSLQTIGRKIQDIVIKSINGTKKTNTGSNTTHELAYDKP